MGNVIQTNIASLNAQRNLFNTNNDLRTSFQRLSSGFRINSAKDDASGLIISNQISKQVSGLNVAIRNANDGISLSQVAEGALQEATNILLRMRDLSLQSVSGNTTASGRQALNAEFEQLTLEIGRIVSDTTFAGAAVLSQAGGYSVNLQVGAEANSTDITVTIANLNQAAGTGITVSAETISTAPGASQAITAIDAAIDTIDTLRGDLGAVQNRLTSTINNLQNIIENSSAARSRIRDTDFAVETSNLAKNQVLQQAGLSILSQANASGQGILSLLQG
ncbi:flagellin [Pleionea mediterranea]|jgi:flagellin|uniref:Flagellin n=1 Tax=Pleionea mediterranea TaxID=523701 RepID=A0A316FLM7_9GAMM|nr:flagellin [Pleionea mediterranea]PWK49173.1 flagellin [Pleionea mediterranea]